MSLSGCNQADKHTIIGSVIKEYQGKGELSDMKREIMSLGAGAYTGTSRPLVSHEQLLHYVVYRCQPERTR